MLSYVSLAVLLVAVSAATPPARFEVTSLPGWEGPLPSKMYTGFVDAGTPPSGKGTMYFHYWMVMAEKNPETAPTVFWYNGGPGASSLFGLLGELGPLFLNVDSYDANYKKTGIPTPQYNNYTWSKYANLVAVDSPAPVGFSYCTEFGPSGNGTSCGPWKDTDVFKANHKVVTRLLNDIFPELKKNELYITGESYAGVYVPGLINELLSDLQGLNLKGYAVGDGCMGSETVCLNLANPPFVYPNTWAGPWYDIEFFHGHGQVSNKLYNTIRSSCSEADLRSGNLSAHCNDLVKQMAKAIGGYFVYDLYDDCPSNEYGMFKGRKVHKALSYHLKGAVNDYVCGGNAMNDWIARPEVKTALGIPVDDFFFNADNGHGFSYTSDVKDVRPIHKRAIESGLRVVIYEGDADACGLSSYGLQDVYTDLFNKEMKLQQNQEWRPWTSDGNRRMAGYAMEWNNRQVSFLTIRGSGHMVPLNKPIPAKALIEAFIFNKEWPEYKQ